MDTAYSLSDIASILNNDNNGWGGNSAWLIILFVLIFGWGGNRYGQGEFGQYATAASQQDILFGQKFSDLDNKIDRLGNGLADLGFSLNNSITNEGRTTQAQLANCCCENQRNTDALRYDMAQQFAVANANTTAQTQKILDALCQNKIDSLQAQVSELKTQNMFCGIPRINNYAYGIYPYSANGCGCGTNAI